MFAAEYPSAFDGKTDWGKGLTSWDESVTDKAQAYRISLQCPNTHSAPSSPLKAECAHVIMI
jgi:hypothetical protein